MAERLQVSLSVVEHVPVQVFSEATPLAGLKPVVASKKRPLEVAPGPPHQAAAPVNLPDALLTVVYNW